MHSKTWQLQEAKNRFSEVVDSAIKHGAQTVTKHGRPAVVIVSVEEYRRATEGGKSLLAALRECPEDLGRLDLNRPKDRARDLNFD